MSAADTIEDVEMKEEKVRVDALQKSELNSYLGWKTISHSGIETLGWEMEPKASPTFMICFDLGGVVIFPISTVFIISN